MWALMGPYPCPKKVAAATNWLISIYKFVGGGLGRIPLQRSESTKITALAENGGTRSWSHVTKGSYKTSAIFYHVIIGSLATSALAAFLIFKQAHSTTCLLFLSLALYLR